MAASPRLGYIYAMSAQMIDGLKIAADIRADLKARTERLRERGVDPGLAFVIVGNNPASISYVRSKAQACGEIGIRSETINLPETTSEAELLALIERINADPAWHGMIVQLPLPAAIDPNKVAS